METVTAYLGLGSNLGDRRKNLESAAQLLFQSREDSEDPKGRGNLHLLRSSSVYETAPWGYANQPDYLNCVLEVETNLPPDRFLEITQGVEREMGREWSLRYGPRVIDIDILFYGHKTIGQEDLQIPHPRLHQRAFVLVPLAELAPKLTHPVLDLTVDKMKSEVDGKTGVKPWGPPLDLARLGGTASQA